MKRTRFVVVPAETLFAFLEEKGFVRTVRFREVVYERKNHLDERYAVRVYTSVRHGEKIARDCGADAIRICAVFRQGLFERGVAKLPKILRTGSVEKVLGRVLERSREAYGICNEKIRRNESKRYLAG